MRGADFGDGGAFVEGVVGGLVKEVDAGGGRGGEGAVNEVEGVGVWGEFVAEGGWIWGVSYGVRRLGEVEGELKRALPVWDLKIDALVPLP